MTAKEDAISGLCYWALMFEQGYTSRDSTEKAFTQIVEDIIKAAAEEAAQQVLEGLQRASYNPES